MADFKTVTAHTTVRRHRRSAGLSIAALHGEHLPEHLDPFLGFDHFEMAEPFFPPHPHAGFSAVTYMFPQSAGGFVNRDSRGDRSDIRPGDLHWTAAGRGVVHEEVPLVRGVTCEGLQIFVNLPATKKWQPPEVLHLDASDVPRVTTVAGGEVRVVLGRHGDTRSPLRPPTDVTMLDVILAPGERLEHATPAGESRFVYLLEGSVEAGPAGQTRVVRAGEAAGFSQAGSGVRLVAGPTTTRLMLAGGRPLREPALFLGPFCMTTRTDLARAVEAYDSGQMGHLVPSF